VNARRFPRSFVMVPTYLRRVICTVMLLLLATFWLSVDQLEAQSPADSPPPIPLWFECLSLEDGLSQNAMLAIWDGASTGTIPPLLPA